MKSACFWHSGTSKCKTETGYCNHDDFQKYEKCLDDEPKCYCKFDEDCKDRWRCFIAKFFNRYRLELN